jgi:hypothetical protein
MSKLAVWWNWAMTFSRGSYGPIGKKKGKEDMIIYGLQARSAKSSGSLFAHILFFPYFWLDLILAIRNTPNNLNYLRNQTLLKNSKILA